VGYEVVLALEVTIGVTAVKPETTDEFVPPMPSAASGEFSLTEEDEQLLRGMKIGVA
jgi:hypothetical protein